MYRKTSRAIRYMNYVTLVFVLVTGVPIGTIAILLIKDKPLLSSFVLALAIFMILGFVVKFITDLRSDILCGQYTFDNEKMVFRCPTHITEFRYEEIVNAGITKWFAGSPRATFPQFIYFIYLSRKELTTEQQNQLVKYRLRKINNQNNAGMETINFLSEVLI